MGTVPAKKRVIRICDAISSETGRNKTRMDAETVVGKLNRRMVGWANYFCLGPVSKAYRAVEQHARKRLRQWLCAKHKVRGRASGRFLDADLHDVLGLVRPHADAQFSVGELVNLSPGAGCVSCACPVR